MDKQFLKIAGHCIEVDREIVLPYNFKPFMIEKEEVSSVITTISIGKIDIIKEESDWVERSCLDDSEDFKVRKNFDGSFSAMVKVNYSGDMYFMYSCSNWSLVKLSDNCKSENCPLSVINKFIMLTFIYASSYYKTVLIHASSVRVGIDAVAFIGHSGVGKSTHSRLWIEHIKNAELVNDDQPAVRVFGNNTVMIYGTPWSGKTPCYRSVSASLESIVCMRQAKDNMIISLSPLQLLSELYASCSMMKSDVQTLKNIISTIVEISSSVHGFILENRPEAEAAILVYNHTIGGI